MVRQNYKTASTPTLELIKKANKTNSYEKLDMMHLVLTRSAMLKDEIIVFKISSTILGNEDLLTRFLKSIALFSACQAKVVIVHEGGVAVENALKLFGINSGKIQDMQMSDYKSASIIEMVLSGHINKKIVSMLCEMGCNTIGISGKDCDIIRAQQKAKKVKNDNIVSFGFGADPVMINTSSILMLLESDMSVVLSPIASGDNGTTCIIDANIISSLLAAALAAKYLILPCDTPGKEYNGIILTDYDRHHLKQIRSDPKSSAEFKVILDTATSAMDNYVDYICIVDEQNPESILQSIFGIETE